MQFNNVQTLSPALCPVPVPSPVPSPCALFLSPVPVPCSILSQVLESFMPTELKLK